MGSYVSLLPQMGSYVSILSRWDPMCIYPLQMGSYASVLPQMGSYVSLLPQMGSYVSVLSRWDPMCLSSPDGILCVSSVPEWILCVCPILCPTWSCWISDGQWE